MGNDVGIGSSDPKHIAALEFGEETHDDCPTGTWSRCADAPAVNIAIVYARTVCPVCGLSMALPQYPPPMIAILAAGGVAVAPCGLRWLTDTH